MSADCLHCEGWNCTRCRPPQEPGEQGLNDVELELVKLRNRVRELEVALGDALKLYTQADDSNTYERYRAACTVLEATS